jgi:hypothetical protein
VTRGNSASDLRRRPKGVRYTQRQLDDALAGKIKLRDTREGSAARQALRRAQYARRVESNERLRRSRATARGHAQIRVVWSDVVTKNGVQDVVTNGSVETRRVAQHKHDVRGLLEGRVSASEFRQRWRRRVLSAGGQQLEADPDQVLVIVAFSGPGPQDHYRRLPAGSAP